jgi:hypothetical protein
MIKKISGVEQFLYSSVYFGVGKLKTIFLVLARPVVVESSATADVFIPVAIGAFAERMIHIPCTAV